MSRSARPLQHHLRFLLLPVLVASGYPAEAAAHVGAHPPMPSSIALHPDDPELIAVRARSHGLVVSEDGGASWRMMCRSVPDTLASERIRLAYATDGALLLASFDGLQRAASDACGWRFPDALLEKRVTRGLQRHPRKASTFFAATSQGGTNSQTNGVYRSDDDGRSWMQVGEDVEGFLSQLRIAPSEPERMYLTRVHTDFETDTVSYSLRVSDDGGATWTQHEFPLVEGEEESFGVLYVDPQNPDLVLAVVRSPDAHEISEDETIDRIIRSEDAGQSWSDVLEVSDFGGLAARPDGSTIWIGDTQGGLWRSEDGAVSFQLVHPELEPKKRMHVYDLQYAHGKLWIGGHDWLDGFSLGVSENGGKTVLRTMRWDDITRLATCPQLDVGTQCSDQWHGWATDVLQDGYGPPRELGDPAIWPPSASSGDGPTPDTGAAASASDAGATHGQSADAGTPQGGGAPFDPDAGAASAAGSGDAGGFGCSLAAWRPSASWSVLGWLGAAATMRVRRRRPRR